MRYRTANEIRETFLDFFRRHDHHDVAASGILPQNDPTLLFINSGMAPMKPYFLGHVPPPYQRLTNVQPCIRTVDISDVGDSYHGSSFRMMGSWSFGDYFKERAIELAFELITEGFGFPAERLYATVYGGDNGIPDVPPDEESASIWRQYLADDRIIRRPAADNFWGPAGTSGPCGPCTEVFYDRGAEYGLGGDDSLVNGRHIEIWNAGVFMQYNWAEDGGISPLPTRCVDTGAGLERFAMLLQNAPSIHEIDQYAPAYRQIVQDVSDVRKSRVMLDHLKSALMMMAEGVTPGNQRHAYVLRRLLRRTLTMLYVEGVDFDRIDTHITAVTEVIDQSADVKTQAALVSAATNAEKTAYAKILGRAAKYLARIEQDGKVTAKMVFEMKATYGIPTELVEEFCLTKGIAYPQQAVQSLLEQHRETSRG